MTNQTCTEGVTLEELLTRPLDLLVLIGAEDDNDDDDRDGQDDDADDSDDEDSDDDRDGDDEDNEDKDKKDKPGDPADRKIQNLTEDRDRQYRKRKDAETRVSDLQKEIDTLKANGTQDETLKKELTETQEANQRLSETNRQLSLQNAFLASNAYEWQDPAAALKLADLDDVEIDDKGNVDGMKVALDALAKKSPYLLKSNEQPKKKPAGSRSGSQPTPRQKQTESKRKTREAELRNKYPALRK